jgi:hypothetical protein
MPDIREDMLVSLMGTFADTANVDYSLSSVVRFRLQQTSGSCRFPFSVIYIYMLPFYEKIKHKTNNGGPGDFP